MENYEKLKEIGKGSYGVVWLVKTKKEKKNFVLKRIDLRKSPDRDKKSAQQEAQLLKNLKHPNIVSYKESFQNDGYLNIVMLFCDGGDLYTKIKEQNGKFLEESQIVEWFVQIAMALQYMHDQNILHRDLKTQNIFLTKNKIIKVGDLGIARVLKSTNDMATTIIGTPYYMSPELFSNKPYNSKSDVWALGCCVYEMTTLKHAFNAKDMTSLVLKITRGKMPAIPQHYSRDFINLIESMLNADPRKRPSVSKILRDQFIKKNIILFLERTKLKQAQNLEKENKMKIEKSNSEIPKKNNFRINSAPNSESEFKKNSEKNLKNRKNSPQRCTSAQSNKNIEESEKKNRPRVRISSVVENIETRECFRLQTDSVNEFEDTSSESDEKANSPYELTRPYQKDINSNQQKLAPQIPKIIEKSNDSQIPVQANMNARERRRQKLRLSQNESSTNDLKPPILRRLEAKPQKSEHFYNSDNRSNKYITKNVSKSCNDIDNEKKPPLVDSLKIFRNIKPMSPSSRPVSKSSNELREQKDCSFLSKKIGSSQSSSSSSIASSNDDDPGKELIRIEKRKKRDQKELDTFIGHLNSTLNAANLLRCDSEMDDLKDEILEDLEEEVIQSEKDNNYSISNRTNNSQTRPSYSLSNSNYEDIEIEDDDEDITNNRTIKKEPANTNDSAEFTIGNMGATNHMHNRINQLEKELLGLIGPEKLEECFKILDSFKEDEIKSRLTKLIGHSLYESNSGKLWLLKFCKDTAKISVR